MFPEQVPEAQLVPALYLRHEPEPSHLPSVPQVLVACVAQLPFDAFGARPVPIGAHAPSAPLPFLAAVHAWQLPEQA